MNLDMILGNPTNLPSSILNREYNWKLKSSQKVNRIIEPKRGLLKDWRVRYHECIQAEFETKNNDFTVSYLSVHTPPIPDGFILRDDFLRIHELGFIFENGLLFNGSNRRNKKEEISFHISREDLIYINGNAMIRNVNDFVFLEKKLVKFFNYCAPLVNSQYLYSGSMPQAENINNDILLAYSKFIKKISSELIGDMPIPFDANLKNFLNEFDLKRFYVFPFDDLKEDWSRFNEQTLYC